jgi:hypothetical protein
VNRTDVRGLIAKAGTAMLLATAGAVLLGAPMLVVFLLRPPHGVSARGGIGSDDPLESMTDALGSFPATHVQANGEHQAAHASSSNGS